MTKEDEIPEAKGLSLKTIIITFIIIIVLIIIWAFFTGRLP